MINAPVRISVLMTLALLIAAQALFLPWQLTAILTLIWICLLYSSISLRPIAKLWTYGLVFSALGAIYLSYQTFIGIEAGVSVLTAFLFAKALETKTQRDVIILFNFALFVSASSFLFSQSFFMAVAILLCLISSFTGLYRLQTAQFSMAEESQWRNLKQDAAHVGKFLLYALPFFVLLFLFFPRLPPLWHIPIPENKATTGMSDTMSPGDIASLSQSSALAFRVIGNIDLLPARNELYWRALALDQYDGSQWTSSAMNLTALQPRDVTLPKKPRMEYQYLSAGPQSKWIMGLDKSVPMDERYELTRDWRIETKQPMANAGPMRLMWVGNAQAALKQPQQKWFIQLNTQTASGLDLKSQALAKKLWMQSAEDPRQYIHTVLKWYQQQGFSYTLNPGLLGQNRIDDFLFGSRKGFCEHYASSFVMMMRYAGIPARVVVGYQGGQAAPDGKSWEVRQLDAHAWTEVWLNGKWQRFDPTAIIAPQRIDSGMQQFIAQDESVWGDADASTQIRRYAMLTQLRIWSDYASYQWQSKVVGYDAESQQSWFSKIGLKSAYAGALAMLFGFIALGLIYAVWLYIASQKNRPFAAREILRWNKQLPAALKKQPYETFSTWMSRLSAQPGLNDPEIFLQAARIYNEACYMDLPLSKKEKHRFYVLLKECANALKKL